MWYVIIGLYVIGMLSIGGWNMVRLSKRIDQMNLVEFKLAKGDPIGYILAMLFWPAFIVVKLIQKDWV